MVDPANVLRDAVAAAVMAPSSHNTQPWKFRIRGATLDVLADPERWLRVIDAERRQQIQSCACSLYNARVAVHAMGWEASVSVMAVDAEQPGHLASLNLTGPRIATDDDRTMMNAVALRRTNRRGFLDRPVAPAVSDALALAAEVEGAAMVRLTPEQKHALGSLVERADELQFGDPAFRAEVGHWLTTFGSRRKDGIPFVEKEYGSSMPFSLLRALRSPVLGSEFGKLEQSRIDISPLVVVLGTSSDDPMSWFAAGMALEAVLLRATALGFAVSFLNQVLEIPALRESVRELAPEVGYPHMILRIGIPTEPIQHAAPRRDLADVIVTDD